MRGRRCRSTRAGRRASRSGTRARGGGITLVDANGDEKPSRGDYEVATSVYVHPKSGKPLGRGSVVCTQIDAAGLRYQCQGAAHFAGGDIVTAGLFPVTAKSFALAIVGGTGVYAGSRGTLRVTWLDAKFARARAAFTLEP
jgi:hypothetical protein